MKQLLYICLATLLTTVCTACEEEEYRYPDVKLEFLTAASDAQGKLIKVITDDGVEHQVAEDGAGLGLKKDTVVRIVCNYESTAQGVILYKASVAISPLPQMADRFTDGVRHDPADVLSIWPGWDYLNLMLEVKAQTGKHLYHFVEEEVLTDESVGTKHVKLSLFHDENGDVRAYTRRVYASIPLRHYFDEGINRLHVTFSLPTYSGETKSYEFDYLSH